MQQAFKKSLAEEPPAPTLEQMCGTKRMNDIEEMNKLEDVRMKQVKRCRNTLLHTPFFAPTGRLMIKQGSCSRTRY